MLVLSSFFLTKLKRAKTVQTNMESYVDWAIEFKSDFTLDLRGCLEATVASKPHLLYCSPNNGSSPSSNKEPISSKFLKKSSIISPKILLKFPKLKFSISLHVKRNSTRPEPCFTEDCTWGEFSQWSRSDQTACGMCVERRTRVATQLQKFPPETAIL